jgi:hypothetical protein
MDISVSRPQLPQRSSHFLIELIEVLIEMKTIRTSRNSHKTSELIFLIEV